MCDYRAFSRWGGGVNEMNPALSRAQSSLWPLTKAACVKQKLLRN
jgi:hypothetical protein